MNIGERIKKSRISLGKSQVQLADEIGVSKQTLYKYENGIIINIPSQKIDAIAKALFVSPSYILGWEDCCLSADSIRIAKAYQNADNKVKTSIAILLGILP